MAFERREPYEGKPSSTSLRRADGGNAVSLFGQDSGYLILLPMFSRVFIHIWGPLLGTTRVPTFRFRPTGLTLHAGLPTFIAPRLRFMNLRINQPMIDVDISEQQAKQLEYFRYNYPDPLIQSETIPAVTPIGK